MNSGKRLLDFSKYLYQKNPDLALLFSDRIILTEENKLGVMELDERFATKEQNEEVWKIVNEFATENPA